MSAREDVHIKGAQSKGGSFFDMRFISAFQCLFVLVGAMIDWTFYDRPKLSNFRIGLGKLQKSAKIQRKFVDILKAMREYFQYFLKVGQWT